jgi:acetylornithine deacetylase/succinyl-diaminopimelate desuccinylase-like protein
MAVRRDALAGAAEMISLIEDVGRRGTAASLVTTVGELRVSPGASNVIPGGTEFSIDVRAADDAARGAAVDAIRQGAAQIAEKRGLSFAMETVYEKPVAVCAPRFRQAIGMAITGVTGKAPRELMSGAGHDGLTMIRLTDIGMIFVRCRAGISHNPLEFVSVADMGLAVEALIGTIEGVAAE